MSYIAITILLILCSCSSDLPDSNKKNNKSATVPPIITKQTTGCKSCHDVIVDTDHAIECSICHNGNDSTNDKSLAHKNLIYQPAHPDYMLQTCGKCHKNHINNTTKSLHFTLKNSINKLRHHFGANEILSDLTKIPTSIKPENNTDLADDLLRRRCLRCHPYYSGEKYPYTTRGTGCAACHLSFEAGKLVSHTFESPGDYQCLQCHYGNRVGFDYYGRFEHDFNDEYRTPYTTSQDYFRPYGIEYHQLAPDIHQQRGMVCIDCHSGDSLMNNSKTNISCADCHDENINTKKTIQTVNNPERIIPLMRHPAHKQFNDKVGCQVCHAQWSFNDFNTSLLRVDNDNYESFDRVATQGSHEIETIIFNNIDFNNEEMPLEMTDKIDGYKQDGIWLKGYKMRRWEEPIIGKDEQGKLQIMRPLLDLQLSWVDDEDFVKFDAVKGVNKEVLSPYTPHTTGPAGIFWKNRVSGFKF